MRVCYPVDAIVLAQMTFFDAICSLSNMIRMILDEKTEEQREPSFIFYAMTVALRQSASLMNHFCGIKIHYKYNIM